MFDYLLEAVASLEVSNFVACLARFRSLALQPYVSASSPVVASRVEGWLELEGEYLSQHLLSETSRL